MVPRKGSRWPVAFCAPTATGTVMRPDTLRRYATDAGFARVDVLPVQDDFFRFYRLHP